MTRTSFRQQAETGGFRFDETIVQLGGPRGTVTGKGEVVRQTTGGGSEGNEGEGTGVAAAVAAGGEEGGGAGAGGGGAEEGDATRRQSMTMLERMGHGFESSLIR